MRLCHLLLVTSFALLACTRSTEPSSPSSEAKAPLERAKPAAPADTQSATPPAPAEPSAPAAPVPAARISEPLAPGQLAPAVDEWTAGIVEVAREGAPVTLKGIRTAKNDGFDRIVFEFAGAELPGYHVEYVDRPAHHCGSGAPLEIPGDALLEVSLRPAAAHDEAGQLTIEAQELKPGLPVVLELEQSCDFEGVTSFVAGVKSPNRYRVLALKDPARLVVDVRH